MHLTINFDRHDMGRARSAKCDVSEPVPVADLEDHVAFVEFAADQRASAAD